MSLKGCQQLQLWSLGSRLSIVAADELSDKWYGFPNQEEWKGTKGWMVGGRRNEESFWKVDRLVSTGWKGFLAPMTTTTTCNLAMRPVDRLPLVSATVGVGETPENTSFTAASTILHCFLSSRSTKTLISIYSKKARPWQQKGRTHILPTLDRWVNFPISLEDESKQAEKQIALGWFVTW